MSLLSQRAVANALDRRDDAASVRRWVDGLVDRARLAETGVERQQTAAPRGRGRGRTRARSRSAPSRLDDDPHLVRSGERPPAPGASLIVAVEDDPAYYWTAADGAELDVLIGTLVGSYFEHRDRCEACRPEPCARYEAWLAHEADCRACQGDAPLTYGPSCAERRRFLDEHRDCARCLPCPHLQRAIAEVVDWRAARMLLSRAEYLRAEQRAREVAS